jgi:hypothetical protein
MRRIWLPNSSRCRNLGCPCTDRPRVHDGTLDRVLDTVPSNTSSVITAKPVGMLGVHSEDVLNWPQELELSEEDNLFVYAWDLVGRRILFRGYYENGKYICPVKCTHFKTFWFRSREVLYVSEVVNPEVEVSLGKRLPPTQVSRVAVASVLGGVSPLHRTLVGSLAEEGLGVTRTQEKIVIHDSSSQQVVSQSELDQIVRQTCYLHFPQQISILRPVLFFGDLILSPFATISLFLDNLKVKHGRDRLQILANKLYPDIDIKVSSSCYCTQQWYCRCPVFCTFLCSVFIPSRMFEGSLRTQFLLLTEYLSEFLSLPHVSKEVLDMMCSGMCDSRQDIRHEELLSELNQPKTISELEKVYAPTDVPYIKILLKDSPFILRDGQGRYNTVARPRVRLGEIENGEKRELELRMGVSVQITSQMSCIGSGWVEMEDENNFSLICRTGHRPFIIETPTSALLCVESFPDCDSEIMPIVIENGAPYHLIREYILLAKTEPTAWSYKAQQTQSWVLGDYRLRCRKILAWKEEDETLSLDPLLMQSTLFFLVLSRFLFAPIVRTTDFIDGLLSLFPSISPSESWSQLSLFEQIGGIVVFEDQIRIRPRLIFAAQRYFVRDEQGKSIPTEKIFTDSLDYDDENEVDGESGRPSRISKEQVDLYFHSVFSRHDLWEPCYSYLMITHKGFQVVLKDYWGVSRKMARRIIKLCRWWGLLFVKKVEGCQYLCVDNKN